MILIFFLFQWMSLNNLFPVMFLKVLNISFGCGCYWCFNIRHKTNHLSMNEKFEYKDHQYIWEKSVSRKPNLNLIRVIQTSSFDQSVVCVWLECCMCLIQTYLKRFCSWFLVLCSERLLDTAMNFNM